MAEKLQLRNRVLERPLSHWRSIAVELLGSQTHIIKGERWHHRVVEKGEGQPLFLYHGIGGHIDTYARTLPALAKHFRTFAVDALYHGYSSREPWEPERRTPLQAEAYIDLIHALGYEKANFEGESMGTAIGFELGMSHPETVDKMVLNGFGNVETKRTDFKEQPWKGNLFELSRTEVLDPTYENIQQRLLRRPDRRQVLRGQGLRPLAAVGEAGRVRRGVAILLPRRQRVGLGQIALAGGNLADAPVCALQIVGVGEEGGLAAGVPEQQVS